MMGCTDCIADGSVGMTYINGERIDVRPAGYDPELSTNVADDGAIPWLYDEFAGIATINRDRFVLVLRNKPVVLLIEQGVVISSCTLPIIDDSIVKDIAITPALNKIVLLFEDASGRMFLLWCSLKEDVIAFSDEPPMPLPQAVFDSRPPLRVPSYMDNDFTVGESDINILGTPVGLAHPQYKPWIEIIGSQLIISVVTWQYWNVTLQREMEQRLADNGVPFVDVDTLATWTQNVKFLEHTKYQVDVDYTIANLPMDPRMVMQLQFKVPFLQCHVITLDYLTGYVENVELIGQSPFEEYRSTPTDEFLPFDTNNRMITFMMARDQRIYRAFSPIKKRLSKNCFRWADQEPDWISGPPDPYEILLTDLTDEDLVRWWDTYHLTWKPNREPVEYLSGEDIVPEMQDADGALAPPFNINETIISISHDPQGLVVYALSSRGYVYRWDVAHYLIRSMHNGTLLDTRTDIMVGRVLVSQPKILQCEFINDDDFCYLLSPKIRILPDVDYVYYMYTHVSLDGVVWEFEIALPDVPVGASVPFFVKVETDSTILDPKPVKVIVSYTRGIP